MCVRLTTGVTVSKRHASWAMTRGLPSLALVSISCPLRAVCLPFVLLMSRASWPGAILVCCHCLCAQPDVERVPPDRPDLLLSGDFFFFLCACVLSCLFVSMLLSLALSLSVVSPLLHCRRTACYRALSPPHLLQYTHRLQQQSVGPGRIPIRVT